MAQELRLFEGDEGHGDSPPLICSLNALDVGEPYTFDPPLHIAAVTFTTKHRTRHGNRHPNFLKDDIIARGLVSGTLIRKGEFRDCKTGTFTCEAKFHNTHTDEFEVARYTVVSKFSDEQVVGGTTVDVRHAVDETMRRETGDEETMA